jgi:cation:H+ antiporter
MIFEIPIFLFGFFLLIKGANFFVTSASRIAKKLGVSEFIIGLTLVAFGTSVPELANAIISSFKGYGEIIIGNIVGSNIINISLILGSIAIIKPLEINKDIVNRDSYIMVFVAIVFYLFTLSGYVSFFEGVFFLIFYAVYILFLLKSKKLFVEYNFKEFLGYFLRFEYIVTLKELASNKDETFNRKKEKKNFRKEMIKDILFVVLSLIAIVKGADLVVDGAVVIANYFGFSQTLIGMSVIALGTTLPELSVSIVAAKKGLTNLAIGNLIGSNIANLLLIIGVASLIRPITITLSAMKFTIPFILFLSSLVLFFIKKDKKITRLSGTVLLILYFTFMAVSFIFKI